MKSKAVTPAFVDIIPDQLKEGILYICKRYNIAIHICCCGCGEEVVTPLTPADWSVHREGNTVSLIPSIGNWDFACQSHYWIENNKVIWAGAMTQKQITQVKARDKADKEAYIAAVNSEKNMPFLAKFFRSVYRWLKS